jgi:ATP-dependent DNA helicase PIF1
VFAAYLRGDNVMLSGQAGSGKSHVIKKIVAHASAVGTKYAVCAMTGCAAVVLDCGATTLHSFAGIGLAAGDPAAVVAQATRKAHVLRRWKATRLLIVDEVSAMSRKLFEIIETIARRSTGRNAAFGGIQVIFVGDFHQLPPVGGDEPSSAAFCFESPRWHDVFPLRAHFDLVQVYRQTDETYKRLLSQIRKGSIDEDGIRMLSARVGLKPADCATRIFPLRNSVDFVNRREYAKIAAPEETFEFVTAFTTDRFPDTGAPIPREVVQKCMALTPERRNEIYQRIIDDSRMPATLKLKVGCVVMCTCNVDIEREICNGSQGVVVGFAPVSRTPVVRFRNGHVMQMSPKMFPSEDYPCLAAGQIPIEHAWAVTVHKCQGIGLDCAEVDVGRTVFECNQTYVALSRVRTLDGLFLTSFDPSKIRTQAKVTEFYLRFPEPEADPEPASAPVDSPVESPVEPDGDAPTGSPLTERTKRFYAPRAAAEFAQFAYAQSQSPSAAVDALADDVKVIRI